MQRASGPKSLRRYASFIPCRRSLTAIAAIAIVCLFSMLVWSLSSAGIFALPPAAVSAMVLFMLSLLMVFLWRDFVRPWTRVRDWVQSLQAGELSSRLAVPEKHAGALNEFYRDLNSIASMLEKQSQENNRQLEKYTRHIEAKTRALSVLYSFSAKLNVAHSYKDLAEQLVKAFCEVLDVKAAVVRRAQGGKMLRLAGSGPWPEYEQEERLPPDSPALKSSEERRRVCVPLKNSKDEPLGVLSLYLDEEQHRKRREFMELFSVIGKNLSKAAEDFRLKEESMHLSILKDRAWLANELHDSLAQTISSMRVRVRLLDQSLRADDPPEVVWQSIEEIERSIEEANHEVRHLIQYFSHAGGTQTPGLAKSLDTIVERFRKNNPDVTVYVDQFLPRRKLPEEYEIQIMHIIRESLINVEKHGHASFVHLLIRGSEQGRYRVYIQDNGSGMNGGGGRPEDGHIGLKVMQDRAKSIGGVLLISGNRGQGTSLELTFTAPPGPSKEDAHEERKLGGARP